MSLQMDHPWSQAARILATHLISVAGVVLASHRNLASYVAVTALPPPSEPPAPTPPPVSTPPSTSRIKILLRKAKHNKIVAVTVGITVVLAAYAAVIGAFVALSRFGNQRILDIVCSVGFTLIYGLFFHGTLDAIAPVPHALFYKAVPPTEANPKPNPAWVIARQNSPASEIEWYHRTPYRIACALTLSASLIVSNYYGFKATLAVLPAAWLVTVMSNMRAPKWSARRLTQILLVYIGGIVAGALIIGPIIYYFANKSKDETPLDPAEAEKKAQEKAEEAAKWSSPSDWLGDLMLIFQYIYVIALPGILVCLTWRYDFTRSHPDYLAELASKRQSEPAAVNVPRHGTVKSFTPNLSVYPLYALVYSIVVLAGVYVMYPKAGDALLSNCGALITVPTAVFATMYGAWRRGEFKEWWSYCETWVPTREEAAQWRAEVAAAQVNNGAEKDANVGTDDDKAPLLV